MPIRQVLGQIHSFSPDEIAVLDNAFSAALTQLKIVDRNDPSALVIARAIIELARGGERDPAKLCDGALKRSGNAS